jgi:hypothetical protein
MANRGFPVRRRDFPGKEVIMTKKAETDVLAEAQSIGKVVSSLTGLPSRIDVPGFLALIARLQERFDKIEEIKRQLTAEINAKDEDLKSAKEKIVDMRGAVKGSYGADSTEYELVGGTRTSDRKKPTRKPKK